MTRRTWSTTWTGRRIVRPWSAIALVLAPRELTLFRGREKRSVADLADVELERILGRAGDGALFGLFLLFLFSLVLFDLGDGDRLEHELELRLLRLALGYRIRLGRWQSGDGPSHASPIGVR
jgi:hypothetical protein